MNPRTATRTAETDLEPDAIIETLTDPTNIPKWAPDFADTVEPDGQNGWRVTKNRRAFPIEVVIVGATRTVDYLREVAPGKRGGAYLRVLPRPGGGSVIVMTVPVPSGGNAEQVIALLGGELEALVNLSAGKPGYASLGD